MDPNAFAKLTKRVETFVKEVFKTNDPSHDFLHVQRVHDLAVKIAESEKPRNPNLQLVRLAALMHDIGDSKYAKVQQAKLETMNAPRTVEAYLVAQSCPADLAKQVADIVNQVSFRKEAFGKVPASSSLELDIVRDADKLDAIGAIGIARCLAYGSTVGNPIHNSDLETQLIKDQRSGSTQKPWDTMTAEEYAAGGAGTCTAHFYEKLFHLKDMLVTDYAKKLAIERDAIMHLFITQIERECAGQA